MCCRSMQCEMRPGRSVLPAAMVAPPSAFAAGQWEAVSRDGPTWFKPGPIRVHVMNHMRTPIPPETRPSGPAARPPPPRVSGSIAQNASACGCPAPGKAHETGICNMEPGPELTEFDSGQAMVVVGKHVAYFCLLWFGGWNPSTQLLKMKLLLPFRRRPRNELQDEALPET